MLSDALLAQIDPSWWHRAADNVNARRLILSYAVTRAYADITARVRTAAVGEDYLRLVTNDPHTMMHQLAPERLPDWPRCPVVEMANEGSGELTRRQCVGPIGHEGEHRFDFPRPMGVPVSLPDPNDA